MHYYPHTLTMRVDYRLALAFDANVHGIVIIVHTLPMVADVNHLETRRWRGEALRHYITALALAISGRVRECGPCRHHFAMASRKPCITCAGDTFGGDAAVAMV
jgi:hypothetical protein